MKVADLRASCTSLNGNELKSLKALVAYVAFQQKSSEEVVAAALTTAFGVDDVASLSSRHYDEALRYLVDLRVEKIIH